MKERGKFGSNLNQVIVKFSNNIVIKTVANGMMLTLPVTLIGSLLMVVQMIPNVPAVIMNACTIGVTVTSSFIALYVLLGMAYSMARELKGDIAASMILSLAIFAIFTPISSFEVAPDKSVAAIELGYLGSRGIFVAMIVSILVTWLFIKLCEKKVTIKMPESVPPFVSKTFEAIIPAAIIFVGAVVISTIFSATSFGNIHDFIYTILQAPLQSLGDSIWSALLLMFLSELLWWFGIHGSNVTASILAVLYAAPAYANMEAVAAGGTAEFILNQFFLDVYKGPRALALAVVLLFLCKGKKFKTIGQISVVPSIFGITEPMKFGIPQILNPVLFIPLTVAAPLCIAIAYVATLIGFLPITSVAIPRTMPTFLTGFLAAGWRGLAVQLIQFVAVVLLYLPFMKKLDYQELRLEEETLQK